MCAVIANACASQSAVVGSDGMRFVSVFQSVCLALVFYSSFFVACLARSVSGFAETFFAYVCVMI